MSSSPLVLALPAGARVIPFADGCRAAALDFLNRVSVRPDKIALAGWLRGPYREHVVPIGRMRTRRIESSSVMPGALERLVNSARAEVLAGLRQARDPAEGVSFGFTALASNLVYRCQDADGGQGWVPVAHPRMRLADRVLSLVAADFLLRSDDYENGLFACARCEQIALDRICAAAGVCRAHAHSGIHELVPGRNAATA